MLRNIMNNNRIYYKFIMKYEYEIYLYLLKVNYEI